MADGLQVLVIDDDEAIREVLRLRLESWGFVVETASDGSRGLAQAKSRSFDLVISDVIMPGLNGLELLESLTASSPGAALILMTAHGTVDLAVEAMKKGATDFLTKPIEYPKLKSLLEDLKDRRERRKRRGELRSSLEREGTFGAFVGQSEAMREVYEQIRIAAATDAPVLITGQSGTGKELTAHSVHELGRRAKQAFVPVNTSAIPSDLLESEVFGHERGAFTGAIESRAGCFELADGGTLFLDEIGEMPIELQPKLLRVLEDGRLRRVGSSSELQVDVRIICATNRDPREAIERRCLREDLYYRINVFQIPLPSLRERGADLGLLMEHFLEEFNQKHDMQVEAIGPEAQDACQRYSWPGNVRELRNVMERAVVVARTGWIEPQHLPPYVRNQTLADPKIFLPPGITAAEAERALILQTLKRVNNNKAEAARQLGLDVKTIRNKLKSYAHRYPN